MSETNSDAHLSERFAMLEHSLAYAETIVDTVREPLLVLDGSLRVLTASRAFYQTFGVSPEETAGQYIYNLGNGQWDIPALRTLLEEVLPQAKSFDDFEVTHDFATIGRRVMLLNARRLWGAGIEAERVLLAIEDVTKRRRLEEEIERSNEDLQRFAYVAAHDLRSPLNNALSLSQLLARPFERQTQRGRNAHTDVGARKHGKARSADGGHPVLCADEHRAAADDAGAIARGLADGAG